MEEDYEFFKHEEEMEAVTASILKEQEYIRYSALYMYFKGVRETNRRGILTIPKNFESIKKMLEIFVEYEEYEKCAIIRDWIVETEEKLSKEKSSQMSINF